MDGWPSDTYFHVSALTSSVAVVDLLTVSSSPAVLLAVVFVYAVVVAAVLPFPAEAVLVVPLGLPFSSALSFSLVILVAATGKAVGSLFALRIGYGVSHSGPAIRIYERIPLYERFKRRTLTDFVRRYQYLGLGIALSIPFLPDTAPIYAFSVLDNNPLRFAVAAFVGTVIRLVVILSIAAGIITIGT